MKAPAHSAFLLLATFGLAASALAGDAVMWDPTVRRFMAEYSSTPKGGSDYLTADDAVDSVGRAIRRQGTVRPLLVWKSDRTGYFAVCSGLTDHKRTVAAVGVGSTENESRVAAIELVRKAGAVTDIYIANRYSSYGSDFQTGGPELADLSASPIESEEVNSFSPDNRFALCIAHSRGWKIRRLDLIDLKTFGRVMEVGGPTTLFGSIVWSKDSRRFAFFGEETSRGDTTAYVEEEDGKFRQLTMPDREKYPDSDFGLEPGEKVFETKLDLLRPKVWNDSGDLVVEHVVEIVAEKGITKSATVDANSTMTIHFGGPEGPTFVGVQQTNTRSAPPKEEPTKMGKVPHSVNIPPPPTKAGK